MNQYDKMVLDTAMRAGNILLESGAEIYRVEETIRRIAKHYGMEESSPFIMSSGIFLTAENRQGQIYAHVKHIPLNAVRLHKVAMVNQLSREIEEGHYTVTEARERLEQIDKTEGKRDITRLSASGLGAGCFCYVVGGSIADSLAAFIVGFLLYFFILWLEKREKVTSKIVVNIVGGFLATVLSTILYRLGMGASLDFITIGSIMPLLPGVSFVAAIRDLADGDYIAGIVRMVDALLVTFGIAMGVGLVYMSR